MKIQLLNNLKSDDPLWSAWRGLAEGIPFRQPEWLMTWWDSFSNAELDLFLLGVFHEDQLVGLAPWYRNRTDWELRFLGDDRVCTDFLSVLVSGSADQTEVLDTISNWLVKHHADPDLGWSSIRMQGIPLSDSVIRRLRDRLSIHGCTDFEQQPMNTWHVDLSDGWEAFMGRVKKDTRKLLRRRLESLKASNVQWVHTQDDFDRYFPILIDLHQRRRTSLGEPGCFSDERFTSFLRSAAQALLERRQLQAFSIELNGQVIAVDIGFRSPTHWYCYQSGIAPEALEHEPGKMANVWILSQAESMGIQIVDFLRGDEPYKRQLKAEPHGICDVLIAPPGLRGISKRWIWQSQQLLKDTAKALRKGLGVQP